MMKSCIKWVCCLLIAVGASSCAGLYDYSKVNGSSFVPEEVRLNMNMNDFELLGTTSVSVSYRNYLGVFTYIDELNGEKYDRRNVKKVNWYGYHKFPVRGRINKATYKVLEQYPQADYYVPMYADRQVMRMTLGKRVSQQLVIKAYKLK